MGVEVSNDLLSRGPTAGLGEYQLADERRRADKSIHQLGLPSATPHLTSPAIFVQELTYTALTVVIRYGAGPHMEIALASSNRLVAIFPL